MLDLTARLAKPCATTEKLNSRPDGLAEAPASLELEQVLQNTTNARIILYYTILRPKRQE